LKRREKHTQRPNFIGRRFGTPSIPSSWRFKQLTPPMKMEQAVCSETSAYKIQKPGNHPKGRIQHLKHGKILKSRTKYLFPQPHIAE
jgi:hypothetical protein